MVVTISALPTVDSAWHLEFRSWYIRTLPAMQVGGDVGSSYSSYMHEHLLSNECPPAQKPVGLGLCETSALSKSVNGEKQKMIAEPSCPLLRSDLVEEIFPCSALLCLQA